MLGKLVVNIWICEEREYWNLSNNCNFLLSSLLVLLSQSFSIVSSIQYKEMASGYALYSSHPWFTINKCQFTEATTWFKSSKIYETIIKQESRSGTFTFRLNLVFVIFIDVMMLFCFSNWWSLHVRCLWLFHHWFFSFLATRWSKFSRVFLLNMFLRDIFFRELRTDESILTFYIRNICLGHSKKFIW